MRETHVRRRDADGNEYPHEIMHLRPIRERKRLYYQSHAGNVYCLLRGVIDSRLSVRERYTRGCERLTRIIFPRDPPRGYTCNACAT